MAGVAIVGCGGMGRETAAWALDAGHEVVGFLDADRSLWRTEVADLPVLGDVGWLEGHSDVQVVVAIGDPQARDRLAGQVSERLGRVVHPSAVVGPGVDLGPGAIVGPNAVLTRDIAVGRSVIVNFGAVVGHDGQLDAACFLGPNASLAGNVTVGARVEVGIGASVLQGLTLGEDAVVGGGAVVIRDVAPRTTVVGVPASELGA